MAETKGSEQSGTKYEAPRAVRLSDAATGVASPVCSSHGSNASCRPGSTNMGGTCRTGNVNVGYHCKNGSSD